VYFTLVVLILTLHIIFFYWHILNMLFYNSTFINPSLPTGRRKRFGHHMMMAGMMSGGSMMALAMSAIAMMAGKALMTALLSLMMSAMMTMGGGMGGGMGGNKGGGGTTYEIIHTGGHEIKHRSMEPVATAADSGGAYPYLMPQPVRRNLLIPLDRR
jgi:hypothetical protein